MKSESPIRGSFLTQKSFGFIFNPRQIDFSLGRKADTLSGLKLMDGRDQRQIILTWELTCRQCTSKFEAPVPFGPREEKELECPHCGSKDIERVEALNQDAPQCGG
jgi:rRNA maturation endonuclease Nob1